MPVADSHAFRSFGCDLRRVCCGVRPAGWCADARTDRPIAWQYLGRAGLSGLRARRRRHRLAAAMIRTGSTAEAAAPARGGSVRDRGAQTAASSAPRGWRAAGAVLSLMRSDLRALVMLALADPRPAPSTPRGPDHLDPGRSIASMRRPTGGHPLGGEEPVSRAPWPAAGRRRARHDRRFSRRRQARDLDSNPTAPRGHADDRILPREAGRPRARARFAAAALRGSPRPTLILVGGGGTRPTTAPRRRAMARGRAGGRRLRFARVGPAADKCHDVFAARR